MGREYHRSRKDYSNFRRRRGTSIPWLEGDELDRLRLEHLRMFYLLLKLRRGLLEVIIPRTLVRIEWVKVSSSLTYL
jgi:hypothetical protein